MPDLETRIQSDMKDAMRARETEKLQAIRLILAGLKQHKVDNRLDTLSDEEIIPLLNKMAKQRRESITQYQENNRVDLAEKEIFELDVIKQYLPTPLSDEEINSIIQAALKETGASSMKEMGSVMANVKAKVAGRADISAVSAKIKDALQQ